MLFAPDNGSMAIRDVVTIMLILYLFQGLSVIHGYVHARLRSRIWLTGMYVTFFLLPHALLLLVSGVGLANACLGRKPEQGTDKQA